MDIQVGALVLGKWDDSCIMNEGGWCDLGEVREFEPAACLSVGWMVFIDEARLVIAACVAPEEVGGVTTIPRSCVEEIRELNVQDPS